MRPVVVDVAVDLTHTKGPRSWRYLAGAGLTASTKLRRQYTQTLAAGAVRLLLDDRSRRSVVGVHVRMQIVMLSELQWVRSVE